MWVTSHCCVITEIKILSEKPRDATKQVSISNIFILWPTKKQKQCSSYLRRKTYLEPLFHSFNKWMHSPSVRHCANCARSMSRKITFKTWPVVIQLLNNYLYYTNAKKLTRLMPWRWEYIHDLIFLSIYLVSFFFFHYSYKFWVSPMFFGGFYNTMFFSPHNLLIGV